MKSRLAKRLQRGYFSHTLRWFALPSIQEGRIVRLSKDPIGAIRLSMTTSSLDKIVQRSQQTAKMRHEGVKLHYGQSSKR